VGSLFAGVKFPTGDTDRLDQEVAPELAFQSDPANQGIHAHAFGGIHQHDLTLGSGSYDGIFGAALTARYDRWFFNFQPQFYMRTRAHDYRFGNEVMISGGPGAYLVLNKSATLTLQLNAMYDTMEKDTIVHLKNNETGFTAWYMGPLVNFTWQDHFAANIGVDIPLRIMNNSYQTVPDYRIHGGLSWRF